MDRIYYREGFDYVLAETYSIQTEVFPGSDIRSGSITLASDGLLTISQGYAWDGATGVPDDTTIMRGSLVHDALYQLMREGLLPQSARDAADRLLEKCCIDDGMPVAASAAVYEAVKAMGAQFASPDAPDEILYAPLPPEEIASRLARDSGGA